MFRFIWKQNLENFLLTYSVVSVCFQTNISYISKNKRSYNAKPSANYFYVKTKTSVEFHICISVPLNPCVILIVGWNFQWRVLTSNLPLINYRTIWLVNCHGGIDISLGSKLNCHWRIWTSLRYSWLTGWQFRMTYNESRV